jgi:GT2 family glycosyltransferase
MVERMLAEPDTGAVAPKIYYHAHPDLLWYAGGEISFWTGTMKHTGIREKDAGQYDAVRVVDYATGCAVLVPGEVVARVGMLDTGYGMYGEDADWSLRIRKAGYRIVVEPRARVWHRISVSTGGHLSFYKLRHKFVSNFRFFARYARWYHWPVFPWAGVLVNAAAAGRYLMTSRGR